MHVWGARSVYVPVTLVKKELGIEASRCTLRQILSVMVLRKWHSNNDCLKNSTAQTRPICASDGILIKFCRPPGPENNNGAPHRGAL